MERKFLNRPAADGARPIYTQSRFPDKITSGTEVMKSL